jgi:hypothetical protein
MAKPFQSIQLLFLVPGGLLIFASLYIPAEYAYKQLVWTRTEARFAERIEPEEGADIAYSLLEFTDEKNILYQVKENEEDTMVEGSDDQHFILYYNPNNPDEYVMMNYGRYLLLLFFPLGVLLCYFGWPEKESKTSSGIETDHNSKQQKKKII